MNLVGPIIEIVKLAGGPIVRYLKYQIKFNGYLKKFKEGKEDLSNRKLEIESRLETQLQSAAYYVAKAEVQEWLIDADEFIVRRDVEDEVNSWGYLSCCCRAVILEERTQELKEIYDRGDKYTNECLVIEDHSKKLYYNVKNFKELKEKLQRKRQDIVLILRSQLVYGKIEKEEVKHWREKVEEITGPIAKDIEDKVDKGGYLSHASDPTAVLLREKIQEMEIICEEGSRLPDCLVIDDQSASLVELPTSDLQGSEGAKANILACLKGGEVTKLGVWGMGGVGKTTIMKHVYNELLKEGKFKKLIWVTVSQNFTIDNLQEQIAFSLMEKLEMGQKATNRAFMLSKMLEKQKPYLLILDDVWSSFKLADVGIPEPHVASGCKLVLTTRSQEIARSMGCRRIKVETLSREEALKLFLNEVGDTVLSYSGEVIEKDLESTLKKIVDECDGLPLALITVAGSLKGISESQLWSVALKQLREYKRNVAGTDSNAFQILKFSYDRLKSLKIQCCFLYCALFPEDYNIPKEQIIEYWVDEEFIDEMETRHAMKDEGYDILRKLEDNSLLELIEAKDERDFVRMRDLIRDMALDITRTSPRFLVEAGKALRELPEKVKCTEDVEKVSVMFNQIEEIPSSMASSTCERLTTLLLAHNKLSTIPESVFEHMPELKILDLSFNYKLWSLPNSISKLVKLTTLLLESTSLEKIPSLSSLQSLKKLNMRQTKIKAVPGDLGTLMNLKCLFLCGSNPYNILEIDEIANGVLSNLSKLQELIVDWSRIELKGDVVGRLKKLEVLHGRFPTVNDMRIFLKCQPDRLSSYFITVGSNLGLEESEDKAVVYDVIKNLTKYKKIMVFKETSIVGENMLFPSIQLLCIEACNDLKSLNDFSAIKDVIDLRGCLIWNCDGMECVLSSWTNNRIVQTLELLVLHGLHKLDGLFEAEVIAKSPLPHRIFSSLKVVVITECKKLKKLFPSWRLEEYPQSLETIYVSDCEEMEELIGTNLEGEGGGDIIKLILPKLKELTLRDLPALKSICSKRAIMVCDSLESNKISNCKGLRRIPIHSSPDLSYLYLSKLENLDGLFEAEVIGKSPSTPTNFSSLKEVKIEGCKKIKMLFPSWKLVEYLQSLTLIEVKDCEKMEEIIASDPEKEGRDIISLILPKLKSLTLYGLPALKSICSMRAVMVCDSLGDIQIRDCKGLRRIPLYPPPYLIYLYLSKLNNLDGLFEAEVIAKSLSPPMTLSSLKEVKIEGCKKIKMLFPSWKLVEYLPSLEEIRVHDCKQIEEIIASDPVKGEKGEVIKLILPRLKRLHMELLPALKSICSMRVKMVCKSLEQIQILQCHHLDNLDALFEEVSFRSLKTIWINGCGKIKKLFPWRLLLRRLQSLEEINVGYCEQMEELVASDPGGEKKVVKDFTLPKLKRLRLKFLPALEIHSITAIMVCASLEEIQIQACQGLSRIPLYHLDAPFKATAFSKSPLLPPIYSSLKTISIVECGKMKKLLLSRLLLGNLRNLEEIIVRDCEQMEEIIALDEEEEEEEEAEGRGVIELILPKLKMLNLELLPALKSLRSTRVKMVCDSLELIQILQCHHLENLDAFFEVEGLSKSPLPLGIWSSLKTISIGYCYKIKKLFPSWMLQGNLRSLEEIYVRHCMQMEEIVCLEPEGEKEGVIKLTLPKLKRLKLIYLPTLKRLCSSRAVMVCDSLERVEILRCLHLENLDPLFKEEVNFSTLKIIWINGCGKIKKLIPSLRFLQSLEEINVGCCEQMEELVEKEVVEKEVGTDLGLPKLKRLRLECLPALEIYSITAVMVCASLEEIQILACQRLRRIPLYHLDDLDANFNAKAFSKSPQLPATYSSLKTISIIECGEIKKLLQSRFLLGSLQSLEEIIVRDCEQMEEIIALDPEEEEEKGEIIKLILPKLKKLHLELLPALKSICSTGVKVVCDSLEHIQILQCHHLDNLDDLFEVEENSMSSPPPGICSSLKTIWIDECSKMKKLFSSRLLLENLQSLEEINVRYCAQMEELVASDPEEGELVMDLILPKLKLLELEACPH